MRAVDDEVVALGLAGDRFVDRGVEQAVVFGAHGGAPVGGVALSKAHVERDGAGQAYAVAALTEIMVIGVMKPRRPLVSLT